MRLFLLWVLLSSPFAHAAEVVLFGGYHSTEEGLGAWKALAEKEPRFIGRAEFSYEVYPSTSASDESAVRDGAAIIALWVAEIGAAPEGRRFILVGHSSGCAIANEIARQIRDQNRIQLVVLDGFVPEESLHATCWSAEDGALQALNWSSEEKCPNFRKLTYSGCDNSMCLHFSLVNANARSAGITASNYATTGYLGVVPNLDWVDEALGEGH